MSDESGASLVMRCWCGATFRASGFQYTDKVERMALAWLTGPHDHSVPADDGPGVLGDAIHRVTALEGEVEDLKAESRSDRRLIADAHKALTDPPGMQSAMHRVETIEALRAVVEGG